MNINEVLGLYVQSLIKNLSLSRTVFKASLKPTEDHETIFSLTVLKIDTMDVFLFPKLTPSTE